MRFLCARARRLLGGPRRRGPRNAPPVTAPDAVTVFAVTPTLVAVLANDTDPEGGALALVSATAGTGSVEVLPDGRLRYTSAPGVTGPDTVTYTVADTGGATAQGTLAVTVAGPALRVRPTAEGTVTVDAAPGAVTVTVTQPADVAGTYATDTTLLAGGPVNLAPPAILGTAQPGQTLTARPGLWILGQAVTGEGWQWRRNGTAIAGATGSGYAVTAADGGAALTVVETVTTAAGSRSAASAARTVPLPFTPVADTGLVVWYDASEAATVTRTGSTVTAWAPRSGTGTLTAAGSPVTYGRTIGGRAAIDLSGTGRFTGSLTLPANGNVSFHGVFAIDAVASAFAALIAVDATRDFQFDAGADTAFAGRLAAVGTGDSVTLAGGPFSGAVVVSVLFDRTGTGTVRVFVNGTLAGTGAYTSPLDAAQALRIMSNRGQSAFVDGAAGELIVTASVGNRADYHAYLAARWGIA